MGSAESVGTLHIDVESPNYQSGDTVTGVIHLLMKQPTTATAVLLYLKCTESTQWSVRKGSRKYRHTVTYYGKDKTIRQRFEVHRCADGALAAGQFSFPFAIELPKDAKTSFAYTPPYVPLLDDGRTLATISYKLVAKVENPGAPVDKGKAPLTIVNPEVNIGSVFIDESVSRMTTWCCRREGLIRVKTTFDKTAYTPGETASVSIEVNNSESKLAVTGFRLTLKRAIRIRNGSGNSLLVNGTVNTVYLGYEISPGKPLEAAAKTMQLMIPTDPAVENATTVRGQLIECSYSLLAEVEMNGCFMCCGDTPSVEHVMHIHPPQMEKAAAPKLEGEWNPTVMPKRSYSIGPEYHYDGKSSQVPSAEQH